MDKIFMMLLLAMTVAIAASAAVGGGTPDFAHIVTGGKVPPKQVPVQPVDGEVDEAESEESVEEETVQVPASVEEEEAGSGGAEVEEGEIVAQEEEEAEDRCADVSGVWQSQSSSARLVLVQDVEGDLSGLFRNNSESGWYELRGHRGSHQGAALAFSVVWNEGNTASSVAGHCHSCSETLELHSVHSHLLPGCQSHVVTIIKKSFSRVGDAAEAHTLTKAVFGEDEDVVVEEAEKEEEIVVESSEEAGSGDA